MTSEPYGFAPFVESDDVRIVIETPSGSRTKYAWNPELAGFRAGKVLPLGMTFPFDFGFVPGTKAGDGDPLDALVLADAPLAMGCIVECRVLGAFEARMSERGDEGLVENDRLIVVPTHSQRGAEWRHLHDIGDLLVREIGAFLRDYVEREGRRYQEVRQSDRERALELINASITR